MARSGSLFSYIDLEARVRGDHPLRTIRQIANAALGELSGAFTALYTDFGRPSIAPEKLIPAMLLQAFYGIRSERQLMERLKFDLLFRWFVGVGADDRGRDHSTFSKNRDLVLEGGIAAKFLAAVLAQPKVKRLLSSDHFSVDGTLIEAWASIKSFRGKDGGDDDRQGPGRYAERNFHKEKRSNETYQSTTDPDARLYKKGDGQPAKLCYTRGLQSDPPAQALGSHHVKGRWRIIKMPGYTSDYPDMVEPADILLDGKGGGEFAFGCVTGAIHQSCVHSRPARQGRRYANDCMRHQQGSGR